MVALAGRREKEKKEKEKEKEQKEKENDWNDAEMGRGGE